VDGNSTMQCLHTRSLTILRLYAAILSVIWSDYNGRYCMPTGLTMQAKELESDLVAIQGQRQDSNVQADSGRQMGLTYDAARYRAK